MFEFTTAGFGLAVLPIVLAVARLLRRPRVLPALPEPPSEAAPALPATPAPERPPGSVPLYAMWGGEWRVVDWRANPLEVVPLHPGVAGELVTDARAFLADGARRARLGLPNRRVYLLFGPAGSGKASLALGVAAALERKLYVVDPIRDFLNELGLLYELSNAPDDGVVLVMLREGPQRGGMLTREGLARAMERLPVGKGLLVVVTVQAEWPDPGLLGESLPDRALYVGPVERERARALYESFHPGAPAGAAERFAAAVPEACLTARRLLVLAAEDPVPRRAEG
ncbi:MAG TPA: hypothetical protein VNT60_10565 [Deinococcales bacterium]|nr:hypothetical protein [Deinococcales bacterium]